MSNELPTIEVTHYENAVGDFLPVNDMVVK